MRPLINFNNHVIRVILGITLLATTIGCTRIHGLSVSAQYLGTSVNTQVDSELARYVIGGEDNPKNQRFDSIVDLSQQLLRSETSLKSSVAILNKRHGTDFAALMFIRHLMLDERNRAFRTKYRARAQQSRLSNITTEERRFSFVFIPGWRWQTSPETGAAMPNVRSKLARLGYKSKLIRVDEFGSSSKNAEKIIAELDTLAADGRPLIIVSASKGSADVSVALGSYPDSPGVHAVASWINIGGAIRGSPVADRYLKLRSEGDYWARSVINEVELASVHSMSSTERLATYKTLQFPAHIMIVNYLGVPMSGDVTMNAQAEYLLSRNHGPNDGLVYLTDALVLSGISLIEFGADHYFRHGDNPHNAVALAKTVLAELLKKLPDQGTNFGSASIQSK